MRNFVIIECRMKKHNHWNKWFHSKWNKRTDKKQWTDEKCQLMNELMKGQVPIKLLNSRND